MISANSIQIMALMSYFLFWLRCGAVQAIFNKNHQHGVQGVASSNPAAPTKRINELGQSSDWPFSFQISQNISTRLILLGFCHFSALVITPNSLAWVHKKLP